MFKISKLTDYAVVILSKMAETPDALSSAAQVSELTRLPEPTVAKLLKLLAGGQILSSVRGAHGGYKLAAPADNISLADIVVAIDGPVSLTACVEGSNESCDFAPSCPVNGRWTKVNTAVRSALDNITLADMMPAPNTAKTNSQPNEVRA